MGKLKKIEKHKPTIDQSILYICNNGLKKGCYVGYDNGVGWVYLSCGRRDCFDEWKAINI